VRDDVRDEMLAVGRGHDVSVQRARLDEVVVGGVLLELVAPEFAGFDPPVRQVLSGVGLRATVRVRGIDRLRSRVAILIAPSLLYEWTGDFGALIGSCS